MPEERAAPQVSIIVPVYNVEEYLPRCLDSILAQTLADWECICVDDGSPDGSGAILDEYAARDSRFVVIHKQNGGTSTARNAGLEKAKGAYIGFVDPDDWIEAETYELALDAARRTGADIVQWEYIEEKEDVSVPSKNLSGGFFDIVVNIEYSIDIVWCKLFISSLARQHRFPPGIRRGQDAVFSFITYMRAKKCFYFNKHLYHYNKTRQSSISYNITADIFLEFTESLKKTMQLYKPDDRHQESEISEFLFEKKIGLKVHPLTQFQPPNMNLFRAVFPELNGQMPRYFLKKKTVRALIMLLAAWHLDLPARALLRIRLWEKALKAKIRTKR